MLVQSSISLNFQFLSHFQCSLFIIFQHFLDWHSDSSPGGGVFATDTEIT